jgi:hypothetical protein
MKSGLVYMVEREVPSGWIIEAYSRETREIVAEGHVLRGRACATCERHRVYKQVRAEGIRRLAKDRPEVVTR